MKTYLCGLINGCSDAECKNWREMAKTNLSETLDPMCRDYRGKEGDFIAEIVEGDKVDIDQCGVLLVNYDKPSVGTSMEILYAWEHKIPVIVVTVAGTNISPWLKYHSTAIVISFQQAFDWINSYEKEITRCQ